MSEQLAISIVTAVTGLATAGISGYLAYLIAKLAAGQKAAAVEVEGVKVTQAATAARQDEKQDAAQNTLNVVHRLVNNEMHIALQSIRDLTDWKATHDPTSENRAAAAQAELKLQEHDARQRAVDTGTPTRRIEP